MANPLRLQWEEPPNIFWSKANQFARTAKAGPITCTVLDYNEGEFEWYAEGGSTHKRGSASSLLEAQLAAESAAEACLREGLAAFGDQVVTADERQQFDADRALVKMHKDGWEARKKGPCGWPSGEGPCPLCAEGK